MRKMICLLLTLHFSLVLSCEYALAVSDNIPLYLWNGQGIYIPIYSSCDDCRNNHPTPYYLLNGFPLERFRIQNHAGEKISEIILDDTAYFFQSQYITDTIPELNNGKNAAVVTTRERMTSPLSSNENGIPYVPNISEALEASRRNYTESVIEVYGLIKEKLITFDMDGICFIDQSDLLLTEPNPAPLWGMITKEDAVDIAQKKLREVYDGFNETKFVVSCSLIFYVIKPEYSYFIVKYSLENNLHFGYYVLVDAINGIVIDYDFAKESYG